MTTTAPSRRTGPRSGAPGGAAGHTVEGGQHLPALAPQTLAIAGPLVLTAAVVVGLLHGAVDLAQPDLGYGPPRTRALVGLKYLGAFAAAVTAWWLWPLATLLGLLALSVVHFVAADDVIACWRTGRTPPAAVRVVRALAPGGLPVVHEVALVTGALITLAAAATVVLASRSGDRVGALEPVVLVALTGSGALVAALVLVLSLTVPHAAVVAWQDTHLDLPTTRPSPLESSRLPTSTPA